MKIFDNFLFCYFSKSNFWRWKIVSKSVWSLAHFRWKMTIFKPRSQTFPCIFPWKSQNWAVNVRRGRSADVKGVMVSSHVWTLNTLVTKLPLRKSFVSRKWSFEDFFTCLLNFLFKLSHGCLSLPLKCGDSTLNGGGRDRARLPTEAFSSLSQFLQNQSAWEICRFSLYISSRLLSLKKVVRKIFRNFVLGNFTLNWPKSFWWQNVMLVLEFWWRWWNTCHSLVTWQNLLW